MRNPGYDNNYCNLTSDQQFLIQIVRKYQMKISYTINVNQFNWTVEQWGDTASIKMCRGNKCTRYKVRYDSELRHYVVRKLNAGTGWMSVKIEEVMND